MLMFLSFFGTYDTLINHKSKRYMISDQWILSRSDIFLHEKAVVLLEDAMPERNLAEGARQFAIKMNLGSLQRGSKDQS